MLPFPVSCVRLGLAGFGCHDAFPAGMQLCRSVSDQQHEMLHLELLS